MTDNKANTTSIMDKLKENPGLFAVGLAAVATAGFLIYKSVSGKDGDRVETTQEELENSFFLDESQSARENEQ